MKQVRSRQAAVADVELESSFFDGDLHFYSPTCPSWLLLLLALLFLLGAAPGAGAAASARIAKRHLGGERGIAAIAYIPQCRIRQQNQMIALTARMRAFCRVQSHFAIYSSPAQETTGIWDLGFGLALSPMGMCTRASSTEYSDGSGEYTEYRPLACHPRQPFLSSQCSMGWREAL